MNAFDGEGPDLRPTTLHAELEGLLRHGEGWMTEDGLRRRSRLPCTPGDVFRELGALEAEGLVESRDRGSRNALYRHKQNKVDAPERDLPNVVAGGEAPGGSPPLPSAHPPVPPMGDAPRRPAATSSRPASSFAGETTGAPMKTKARDAILAALKGGPLGQAQIAKKTGESAAVVSYQLGKLSAEKLAARVDPKNRKSAWQLTDAGAKPAASATPTAAAPRAGGAGRRARGGSLAAALDRLERFEREPIADVDTKVQVLDRLSRVVDPAIAAVLTSISKDLRSAAA